MKKPKIFWTQLEEKELSAHLVNAGVSPDDPRLPRAVRTAQAAVLPGSRHKLATSNRSVEGVRREMELLLAKRAAVRTHDADEDRESVNRLIGGLPPVPVVEPKETYPFSPMTPKPEGSEASIGEALGEHVARAVLRAVEDEVNTIVQAMKREIRAQLQAELGNEPAGVIHAPVPVRPARAHKLKLLIVGLLPVQAGTISAEFGEVFDLRFAESDDNLQQLRDSARGVDLAVLFTGKVSHSNQEALRSVGAKIEFVSGGVTSLRQKLTSIYEQTRSAA